MRITCGALLLISCGGQPGNFGTLPEVSVPIEKQPEQDPTLFRDKDESTLPEKNQDPPDPEPLRSHAQYDFVLEFNKGEIQVLSVQEVRLARPQSTPRRMGRFAFELWTGAQLIERVRFDFPLLGASGKNDDDLLGKGLSAQTKVRMPASSRAVSARIIDRKTREEIEVAWPPTGPWKQLGDSPPALEPHEEEPRVEGGSAVPETAPEQAQEGTE